MKKYEVRRAFEDGGRVFRGRVYSLRVEGVRGDNGFMMRLGIFRMRRFWVL